jgi:hypothetical protein
MVAKKGLPSLARRSPAPSHILGNRRLPDLDSMPSLSSSPWILGAPQSGLAMLTSRINCLTSIGTFGRPPRGRDFHRQYKRKPARCQRMTVSGLTIAKALSTPGAKPYSPTSTNRSILPSIGRFGNLRCKISSWWRGARISISSEARDRNNPISPYQMFAELDHRSEASPDSLLFTSRIRFATGTGACPSRFRLFPQTDYLAFRQIELCGKSASVQIELSFEFSRRQQAADGVNVR